MPWSALPSAEPAQDTALTFFDPRFGRIFVFVAALVVVLGFTAPFVQWGGRQASALEAALDAANNLWSIPGAVAVQLWILWTRRSLSAYRRTWVAMVALPCVAAVSLTYSLWHISRSAAAQGYQLEVLWGTWIIALGLCCAVFAGLRLRVSPEFRGVYTDYNRS